MNLDSQYSNLTNSVNKEKMKGDVALEPVTVTEYFRGLVNKTVLWDPSGSIRLDIAIRIGKESIG